MKNIFIILVICLNIFAEETSIRWNNLLHIKNNENLVISKEFYLSNNVNNTAEKELEVTVKYLNSELGSKVACAFPARYLYLKNSGFDIPTFKLENCKDLTTFMKSYSKDKLSLVFSSEYTNNPSSSFGHIMLLLHDKNNPLETGDVVHFAAKTPSEDGFIRYSYSGLTGKYNGYFIREPFFKKIYEYNTLEQRYMYINTLDFSKQQIKYLLYHLFELRKATFKYYFLDANCASQTTDLLNIVESSKNNYNKHFYLPLDTLLDYQHKIIETSKYIPLLNKIDLLLNEMTEKEKTIFFDVIRKNKNVDKTYPYIIIEALQSYTQFNFKKFNKANRNYENIMTQTYLPKQLEDKNVHPLKKSKPSRLDISYLYDNESNVSLSYRPLFISLDDIQIETLNKSEVSVLNWTLLLNKNNMKLNRFDVINITSLSEDLKFYKPLSWSFYFGLNRNNKNEDLMLNSEFALGKTYEITKYLSTSYLTYIGFDDEEIYIKPKIFADLNLRRDYKLGSSIEYKYKKQDDYYRGEIYVLHKFKDIKNKISFVNDNTNNNKKILYSYILNF